MIGQEGAERRLCSVVSRAAGEDPAGTGGPFDALLALQISPPWRRDVTESTPLPAEVRDAVAGLRAAGRVDKVVGLLPDREYSRDGRLRALFWRRPGDGPFARYEKHEYLVPEAGLPALVRALAEPRELRRFEEYREETRARDVLVCTHGSRDVCCGKFGYSVYRFLRSRHATPGGLRVWRTSHLGGHRFAPTLLELPEGRYWGHLEIGTAEDLATRARTPADLARSYRGWAGLGGAFEQVAERDILAREGWAWTTYAKAGEVLRAGEDGAWAKVRITYESPDGDISGAYEALVERSGSVMTLASSGTDPLEEVTQYRVTRLDKDP